MELYIKRSIWVFPKCFAEFSEKKYYILKKIISDSKSCLSGLNWPRSGKNSEFLALFWLLEGTLGIGWKWLVFGSWWFHKLRVTLACDGDTL